MFFGVSLLWSLRFRGRYTYRKWLVVFVFETHRLNQFFASNSLMLPIIAKQKIDLVRMKQKEHK